MGQHSVELSLRPLRPIGRKNHGRPKPAYRHRRAHETLPPSSAFTRAMPIPRRIRNTKTPGQVNHNRPVHSAIRRVGQRGPRPGRGPAPQGRVGSEARHSGTLGAELAAELSAPKRRAPAAQTSPVSLRPKLRDALKGFDAHHQQDQPRGGRDQRGPNRAFDEKRLHAICLLSGARGHTLPGFPARPCSGSSPPPRR